MDNEPLEQHETIRSVTKYIVMFLLVQPHVVDLTFIGYWLYSDFILAACLDFHNKLLSRRRASWTTAVNFKFAFPSQNLDLCSGA